MNAHRCPTCDAAGGDRYCAPLRCYCGHKDCPAFASWVELRQMPAPEIKTTPKPARSTWDDREEDTWIDRV